MFYNDGAYCNAFVRYLYGVYQGTDTPELIVKLTGKSFKQLDEEYKTFMKEIYEQVRQDGERRSPRPEKNAVNVKEAR